jgi:diguanylate cyclase
MPASPPSPTGRPALPVEVIGRTIDYDGRAHGVLAVRDLRDRKLAESRIHFLAHHDPITGLANRTSFDEVLARMAADPPGPSAGVALLCLDLDWFKDVNDMLGHRGGDTVLRLVADRILAVVSQHHRVARLGGDEFAVLMPELGDDDEAESLAARIVEAVRGDYRVANGSVHLSASIGVARFPADTDDVAALLGHADAALYRAKHEGRGTYRTFEKTMAAELRHRRMIEQDLALALERGELALVYQPQAEVADGTVIGFEALLRWTHASEGPVSPAVFVPIAETSGLIHAVGEWVLRTACREAAGWQKPFGVAVNISTLQLHSPSFGALVHSILIETGLSPHRLELEITETALVQDLGRAVATLRQLKTLGVHVAMDDFGTGYSSLSNLRAFPFDKIKIDGSFIRGLEAGGQGAIIVRAMLALGRELGLPVLAEGVETERELAFLKVEGCAQIQGYLIGKPRPIAAYQDLFAGHSLLAAAAVA